MNNINAFNAEDALIKIKALADAAAFLAGNDKHLQALMELLDIISETADLGLKS